MNPGFRGCTCAPLLLSPGARVRFNCENGTNNSDVVLHVLTYKLDTFSHVLIYIYIYIYTYIYIYVYIYIYM